jgi:hypothetical protein
MKIKAFTRAGAEADAGRKMTDREFEAFGRAWWRLDADHRYARGMATVLLH